ncbi:MAG: sugar ABC transporter ATP-binding protein, partial [Pseudomonadota bacterium]|nr:sugar ABC transporter ATP-binding protein [Pseudomonadota bacterium]
MNFIRATLEADGDGYALRIATPDEADLLLPWPTARHTAELVEQPDKPVVMGLRPEHFSEEDVRLSGINRGDA